MGQVVVLGLIAGGIYALFAVGVVLVYRGTGVLSFAQGEIGTVTLYTAALLVDQGTPYWVAAVTGLAVAGALGVLFDLLIVRGIPAPDPVPLSAAPVGPPLSPCALGTCTF